VAVHFHPRGGGSVDNTSSIDPTAFIQRDPSSPATVMVGARSFVGSGSFIGMDTTVGDETVIGRQVYIGSGGDIGDNVLIADDVYIANGITVGDGAFIGTGNSVTVNVAAGEVIPPACCDGSSSNMGNSNVLINGGFGIAQRQAFITPTLRASTTNRDYGHDRWGLTTANASGFNVSSVDTSTTPVTGTTERYFARLTAVTNAQKFIYSQVIESVNAQPLRGRQVTFQVKLKRVGAGAVTARVGFLQLAAAGTVDTIPAGFISAFGAAGTDPTWGTDLAAITPSAAHGTGAAIDGNFVEVALGTTFVNVGATVTVPSDAKNLIAIVFTDGNVLATESVDLSEACVSQGGALVTWSSPDFATELQRCQRYYWKTFAQGTAPAQNIGTLTGEVMGFAPFAGDDAHTFVGVDFAVRMRTTPTVTYFSPGTTNSSPWNETQGESLGDPQNTNLNDKRIYVDFEGSVSQEIGDLIGVHVTAVAEL